MQVFNLAIVREILAHCNSNNGINLRQLLEQIIINQNKVNRGPPVPARKSLEVRSVNTIEDNELTVLRL